MYSRFLECAENEQADLAICLGCVVDAVTQEVEPFRDHALWDALITERIRLLDPARTPDVFLLDTQAGRRLYRRSFLEKTGFKFAEGLVFEDVLASYQLLYRTSRVLLVKEPYYCYRQGHSGRITARKDATILQIIEIMQRVMTELAAHRASAQAWANFIWFQNWVLLWLCSQVEDVHKGEFTAGAIKIARQFPRGGVRYFRDKFANDERAQHGVFLQRLGWGKAYRAFADISEFSSFAKFLFAQKPIHYLIDLWTMSSRSIVLARYFSDERKEGAGLPSLK
jgi:hypothetical protein